MKVDNKNMLLYLVTDRTWLKSRTLPEIVELAIRNGATFIQLREKDIDYDRFRELAIDVKKITDRYNIPFVINDNIKVAIEVGADGVHIGQDDISLTRAREMLGEDKIIGVSVGSVCEAIKAEREGADYLGVGAMFTTISKSDAINVEINELEEITKAIDIPVVAIGGINERNIHQLKGSGVDGIAVISAILAKEDIAGATRELFKLSKEAFYEGSNI
ncbi:MAG: thiamine phosphate synthase [Tissierellaceae bacterium]